LKIGTLFACFALFSLASCTLELPWKEEDRRAIARVHEKILYLDELQAAIPSGLEKEDSLMRTQQFLDSWARNQLLLHQAEFNLSEEMKDFNKRVEDYKNDLIKYAYQEAMLRKLLDTVVTQNQLENYYAENSSNFELKENILQSSYLILSKETPKLETAKKLFLSKKKEDLEDLKKFAVQYNGKLVLSDSTWISMEQLAKTIPIQTYNQQEFLSRNKYVEVSDSLFVYMLKIKQFRITDGLSPLTYVRNTIRSVIINQRKLQLLEKLEQDLLDEALKKNYYEVYEN
jgi:hypothetical protein